MDESGKLIGVIGDEDTVTGFLLAGVGHRTVEGENFLIVKADTELAIVDQFFKNVTAREDVGIILINQHIANTIRGTISDYNKPIPTIVEIPSKDHPYNSEQDPLMQRVQMILGNR